jgi:biotin carboxyl carrier protein
MILKYQNKKHSINISQEYSAILTAKVDKIEKSIRLMKFDNHNFMPFDGDSGTYLYAAKDDKHIYVMIDGFQYIFELLPDETPFMDESEVNDDKHDHIKAPMPGSIVKILVSESDKVEDGTPVIIIEAMKMETKLYSSINGTVSKINCKVGEQVDSDLILLGIIKE